MIELSVRVYDVIAFRRRVALDVWNGFKDGCIRCF